MGRWLVKTDKGAPSGAYVLAQTNTDTTSYRFPVVVADSTLLRAARVSVRCKPVSGKVDQACGLVFRYLDENNYYVVRANASKTMFAFISSRTANASSSPDGMVQ